MAAILGQTEPCYAVQKAQAILVDVDKILEPARKAFAELSPQALPFMGGPAPRCSRCNGTGILGTVYSQDNLMPALQTDLYCDCQTGKDLAKQNKTKFGV